MIDLHQHSDRARGLLLRRFQAASGRPVADDTSFTFQGPRHTLPAGLEFRGPGAPAPVVVASGIAADVRRLTDGRRQILALHLPGDLLDPEPGETAAALTSVDVVDAAPLVRALSEGAGLRSPLGQAWLAVRRMQQAMQRDHIVRLGRMSAYERLGHLLLETHERLVHVGLASAAAFQMPLRQDMIADFLGLSIVHVSRTTKQLKREGLIRVRGSHFGFADRARLIDVTGYVSRFAGALAPPRASFDEADLRRMAG